MSLVLITLTIITAGIIFIYKYKHSPKPVLSSDAEIDPEITGQLSGLLEKAAEFQKTQQLDKAENAYREILRLRRLQAKENSGHQPDVAVTLNNLANLYSDERKYDLAEAAYAEALEIYRQRTKEDPAWEPYVGRTLNNFATLCLLTRQMDRAEKLGSEGVEILRKNWKENPERYGNDLAKTLLVLAYVLTGKDDSVRALAKEAELAATGNDLKGKARKMIEKLQR